MQPVIVGAGWIGAELATAAAALRLPHVTVLEAADTPPPARLSAPDVGLAMTIPLVRRARGSSLRLKRSSVAGRPSPGGDRALAAGDLAARRHLS